MNWYYAEAGRQVGPVDDAALAALVSGGQIKADTLVWREGMANWQPYGQVQSGGAVVTGAPVASGGEAVCAECGNIFPVGETIVIGNSRVCARCKPIVVQKMREGVNVGVASTFHYAGFWIRVGAYFLDAIILGIVNIPIRLALGLGVLGTVPPSQAALGPGAAFSGVPLLVTGIGMAIAVAYETFMIGKYGATLGKMACNIRVVLPDGSRVSYMRAFGRYFAKIVSSIVCLIGYLMVCWDSEKRALHDRICETRVVYK